MGRPCRATSRTTSAGRRIGRPVLEKFGRLLFIIVPDELEDPADHEGRERPAPQSADEQRREPRAAARPRSAFVRVVSGRQRSIMRRRAAPHKKAMAISATSSSREYSTQRPFPSGAESGYPGFVLLLDIFAEVASDTLAGEGLFAALRRQFVEDERTTSLDVRHALERRRRREALPAGSVRSHPGSARRLRPAP